MESRLCLSGAEIHGIAYFDTLDPQPLAGIKVFLDDNADGAWQEGELWTVTNGDGEYSFVELGEGAYRVTEVVPRGYTLVDPDDGFHSVALAAEQIEEDIDFAHNNMPTMVDVFVLVDDTGSFEDPSEKEFFLGVIQSLIEDLANTDTGAYPEISWAFGVGRYEEYGSFAQERSDGRPFVLSQPMIEYGSEWTDGVITVTFDEAIAAAVNRSAPGHGGDGPEAMTEGLYQVATGTGFEGDGDEPWETGYKTDSGPAGPFNTQRYPGTSGDVPAFSTFEPDPYDDPMTWENDGDIIPPCGTLGGVGFREGAMHVVLVATDEGIRYEAEDPPLEADDFIYGLDGVPVEYGRFTVGGREGTPDVDQDGVGDGARIQETVTALNGLEILVIGIGTGDHDPTHAPRSVLEAFAEATGAVYDGSATLENGTDDPIDTGDPLYFALQSVGGYTLAEGLFSGLSGQMISVPGIIAGTVWDDVNDNALWDAGESALGAGITVFLDWNGNGVCDADAYASTTDANGDYAFENLVPGTYHVVAVVPVGYECTTGAVPVVVHNASILRVDVGTHEVTAAADTFETDEDTDLYMLVSDLTDNDADPLVRQSTNDPVWFDGFTQPEHGTLELVDPEPLEGPTLRYVPDANWFGEETFRYSLTDGDLYYDWATVTITVNPVNDRPQIVVTSPFRMLMNGTIGGVLAVDVDDATLSHDLVGPAEGNLTIDNGTFVYAPPADWTGVARFRVRFGDGMYWTDWREFAIYVCEVVEGDSVFLTAEEAVDVGWGAAVAMSGTTAIIGTENPQVPVVVYELSGTAWDEVAQFDSGAIDDAFGHAVAVDGNAAAVGAPFHAIAGDPFPIAIGAVYVYGKDGSTWDEEELTILTAEDFAVGEADGDDQFGYSIAIGDDGNTMVIGAPLKDVMIDSTTYADAGAVYVYHRNGGAWQPLQRIVSSTPCASAYFGNSVDIGGDRIVVGAYRDGYAWEDPGDGAAYIFKRQSNGTWLQTQRLTASDASDLAYFGCDVAIDQNKVAIGAYGCDFQAGAYLRDDAGAVYYFDLTDEADQTETAKCDLGSDATAGDRFGTSVDIRNNVILVGAPGYLSDPYSTVSSLFVIDSEDVTGEWTFIPVDQSDTYGSPDLGASVAWGAGWILAGSPSYHGTLDGIRGGAYLIPYNHTPVAEDLRYVIGGASVSGQLFAIDPYEGSDVEYWFSGDQGSNWFAGSSIPAGSELALKDAGANVFGHLSFNTATGQFTVTLDDPDLYQDYPFLYKVVDEDNAWSNVAAATIVKAWPGDANGDYWVDATDVAARAANWGASVFNPDYNTWWEMGDFNGDYHVNYLDSPILAANWGYHGGDGGGPAAVVGEYLFHKLDQNDDPLIEVDPVVMTVTGYAFGIVGVAVDVDALPPGATIDAADFAFRVGNSTDLENWTAGPAPASIIVHEGEGDDGADRIEIRWANSSILDQWLEVTVLAAGDTGLAEDYTFYVGALRGDATGNGVVDLIDMTRMLDHFDEQGDFGIGDGNFNLDGAVDLLDFSILTAHLDQWLVDLNAAAVMGQYLYHQLDGSGDPIVEEGMTVTGYDEGIVGVAIDIDQLPAHLNPLADITAADFVFEIWDPVADQWIAAPAPSSVTVHLDEGEGGADRIAITWADDSIKARWLRVGVLDSLLGSGGAGVAYHDFIFGSLPGDADGDGSVGSGDLSILGYYYNQQGDFGIADADFNLDGIVDLTDLDILGTYWQQYLEDLE